MNNKKVSISIGIPAYNEEANIAHLLKAIISQKATNYNIEEIIVINDGSTDNTVREIEKTKDKRIKLIVGETRKGQNARLNEMIPQLSSLSDHLLIFEADTLPGNDRYIQEMVNAIPADGKYSVIVSNLVTVQSVNFFGKLMDYGFLLKKELFEKSTTGINLYLFNGGRMLSRQFLNNFRWDKILHEDSYCYRKALQSGLPILRRNRAILYFKTPENLEDFLLQSGKFQRARQEEEKYSQVYKLNFKHTNIILVLIKYIFRNPFYMMIYLSVVTLSRIYVITLPRYSVFWKIYKSTKNLRNFKYGQNT